jgi:hypothetical protein
MIQSNRPAQRVLWVAKEQTDPVVRARIENVDIVLDIGAGICPQQFCHPKIHICVDPHLPYLQRLQQQVSGDSRFLLLHTTWDLAMRVLPDKSVDSVFALDVIEHLDKSDGLTFLAEAERVARRQVVIFTPLGFYPQFYPDPTQPDRWGMHGGQWQEHHSGWEPGDFGPEWELICCERFHFIDQHEQPLEQPFGALWAFRTFASTSPDPDPVEKSVVRRLGSAVKKTATRVFGA